MSHSHSQSMSRIPRRHQSALSTSSSSSSGTVVSLPSSTDITPMRNSIFTSRLPRPMSTTFLQDIWPSDLENADRLAAIERKKLEKEAEFAKIGAAIDKDLEAVRARVVKSPTEEQIAASHARVLAENAKFMARLERECAELDAKDEEESKARRAKWIAESKSPLKQFRLSLVPNVLMNMSTTDITEPVEKRARLVRPRQFVVSSSDQAASDNTIERATPVRQQTLGYKQFAEQFTKEYALAGSSSPPPVPDVSLKPSGLPSSPASAMDPLAYLLNQATTTRLQLHDIESSIKSMLAKSANSTSADSSSTSLTWSSSRNRYELQPSRPATLSIDTISTEPEHDDKVNSEGWYTARDFPLLQEDEIENVDEEAEDLQKMLDAGQEWIKVGSEVMDGMKNASRVGVEE